MNDQTTTTKILTRRTLIMSGAADRPKERVNILGTNIVISRTAPTAIVSRQPEYLKPAELIVEIGANHGKWR